MAQVGKTLVEESAADWLIAMLATVGDGVLGVSPQGNVLFLNPVAETLLACSASSVLGRPASEIMSFSHEHSGAA